MHECNAKTTGCDCAHRGGAERLGLTRRLFLALGGGLCAMLLLPQSSWAKKLAIKLETLPPLKKMGGWMIAKVKEREILFIRDTESNICALSPFCSHQKYRLQYNPETRQIVCKNHGSIFDLKGKALKGPAKEALKPLYWTSLDREKDRLLIKVD